MTITQLFTSGIQNSNLAHFTSLVNIASIDGCISLEEKKLLHSFANKLNISDIEYIQIVENPKKYPLQAITNKEERLNHLYDFFKMILADYVINDKETQLVYRYAIGLGYTPEIAEKLIYKSIKLFNGEINYDDYAYVLKKETI